jgi:hypothetical protein
MAVGDLQKGEKLVLFVLRCHIDAYKDDIRYMNIDYFFFSSLCNTELRTIIVSYDIACQWSRHLWDHMETYHYHLHLDITGWNIIFLVLKFYLPAHVSKCQTDFSFNFTPHVGQTDGEAPE